MLWQRFAACDLETGTSLHDAWALKQAFQAASLSLMIGQELAPLPLVCSCN